ncbi:MAG TPA: hypothetical protein DIU45_16780 [Clostridium sp.]|nr:hypothetical protein [Clostridium sp.]
MVMVVVISSPLLSIYLTLSFESFSIPSWLNLVALIFSSFFSTLPLELIFAFSAICSTSNLYLPSLALEPATIFARLASLSLTSTFTP